MTKRSACTNLFAHARLTNRMARSALCAFALLGLGLLWTLPLPAAQPLCDLDIDGNGAASPQTDGQLLLRHLFGFSGTTLTEGVLGAGCTRCQPAAIATYLDASACQTLLDVDGNGSRDALTDGLLVWRYLAGWSGEPLIADAVGAGCTRCTAGGDPGAGPPTGRVAAIIASMPDIAGIDPARP